MSKPLAPGLLPGTRLAASGKGEYWAAAAASKSKTVDWAVKDSMYQDRHSTHLDVSSPAPQSPCDELRANDAHLIRAARRGTLLDENVVAGSMASRIAHARSNRHRNLRSLQRSSWTPDESESSSESDSDAGLPGVTLMEMSTGAGRFDRSIGVMVMQ